MLRATEDTKEPVLENTGGRKYRRRGAREGPPVAGGTRAKLRRQEGCLAQQMAHGSLSLGPGTPGVWQRSGQEARQDPLGRQAVP